MNLEDRLRRTFRRVEPDEDFAGRVLASLDDAASRGSAHIVHAGARPVRRWALAASVVIALAVSALGGREAWLTHSRRIGTERLEARQETASRQLAFALDLTSRELESVHQHLNRKTEETGS